MRVACAGMGSTPAALDGALAKVGLKQAGTIWVLDAESEVHQRWTKPGARQLSDALVQQPGCSAKRSIARRSKS
jgi:hypothetical protein